MRPPADSVEKDLVRPDQRFFVPHGHEVIYDPNSFDISDAPQVEVLGGNGAYAIVTDRDGEVVGANVDTAHLSSGAKLHTIVGVDQSDRAWSLPFVEPERLVSPTEYGARTLEDPINVESTYEIQEEDLLIVEVVGNISASLEHSLADKVDKNGVLLVPATSRLPYLDEHVDNPSKSTIFRLHGVITKDLRLLGFPHDGPGEPDSRKLVDRCIVLAHLQNNLEAALLMRAVALSFSKNLQGSVVTDRAVNAYLRHFDRVQGTNYTPDKEPKDAYFKFPEMTTDQRGRLEMLSALALIAY
jgi:hypothetical protein